MAPSRGELQKTARVGGEKSGHVDAVPGSAVLGSKIQSPPVELEGEARRRISVVAGFWFIVLVLGLPLWWWTTTVYRADLPHALMNDWSEGKTWEPAFPIEVQVDASKLVARDAVELVQATQSLLDGLDEFPSHHIHLKLVEAGQLPRKDALILQLDPQGAQAQPSSSLQKHSSILNVRFAAPHMLLEGSPASSPLAAFITQQISEIYAEERAILHYISSNDGRERGTLSAGAQQALSTRLEALNKRKTRSVRYASSYHITLSLFTGSYQPSSWEISESMRLTFSPLLRMLSPLSNFTVDTQIQPYSRLSASLKPRFSDQHNAWVLQREDIGGFINAAEWPLSPSIGSTPTINFLIYVPDPEMTPLIIDGGETASASSSWLVPQWGGIAILNPPAGSKKSTLAQADLQPLLLTFGSQLLSLLGVPTSPADSLPLQLQSLRRILTLALISSASATMGALSRLTLSLPSIAIPRTVAAEVTATLQALQASTSALKTGNFQAAFRSAQLAEAEAEKAFFEPSMVGQVYFPDEHKVAVYLPLMGPVAVPLLLSGLKELRRVTERLRMKKTA